MLGASFDPARADSTAVAEMAARGVDLSRPMLVRHHLHLPDDDAVGRARELLAPDGYVLVRDPADPSRPAVGPSGRPGPAALAVRASRTQLVSGLSLAQERSRMAGLAQRLRGDVTGWDVCGPAGGPPDSPAAGPSGSGSPGG